MLLTDQPKVSARSFRSLGGLVARRLAHDPGEQDEQAEQARSRALRLSSIFNQNMLTARAGVEFHGKFQAAR